MEIFRKMSFADSTGDAIPFYHEGKYHIFSLTSPPGTTVYPERLRTTWSHSISDDLVHWQELPTALYPGEGDEPDASGVWTGSVIYGEGQYHAFYTGYCLTAEFQQTICHATSDDGITWTKDITNTVITPMTELYEKLDWRDPYVFYNEEDENYWILISARRLDMPVTRRGCIVLYRSKNLKDWTYYGPIYSPGHTNCPECPEMYKMGGHWYLSIQYTVYQSLLLVHGENLKRMVLVEDAFMLLSQCKMMMEDVFILDGRMIVQSRVTKVNGIGVEHFVFHMKWCQPKMES